MSAGRLWIRIPDNFSLAGRTAVPDLISSMRFRPVSRALAYIAWRLNALQRWLGLPASTLSARDRVTQAAYALGTDQAGLGWTPTGDWYRQENLDGLLALIQQQLTSGGPSALGGHRFYAKEFLGQARTILAAIHGLIWTSLPFGAALFGGSWVTLNGVGARVLSGSAGGGGKFPPQPASAAPADSSTWDFNGGSPAPQASHYLQLGDMAPGSGGWNAGHFEALKHRDGTTLNANRWPPDYQVLSEFNLDCPPTAQRFHGLAGQASNTSGLADEVGNAQAHANYLALGTLHGGDHRYWAGSRPYVGDPLPATTWSLQLRTNVGCGLSKVSSFVFPQTITYGHTFTFDRYGWEKDLNGSVFARSAWDWFALRLGAMPDTSAPPGDTMRLKGTITLSALFRNAAGLSVTPTFTAGVTVVLGTAANDEAAAKAILAGTFSGTTVFSGTTPAAGPPGVTYSFDADISSYLRSIELPLYVAVLISPNQAPQVTNAAAYHYSLGAIGNYGFYARFQGSGPDVGIAP